MSLKLAIFDMDGTLIDSRKVIQSAMSEAFIAADLPPPDYDATRKIVGLGLHEACRRLAPETLSDCDLDKLVHEYKETFIRLRQRPDFEEPMYDGAMDLLKELRREEWLIGMATGKSHRGIRAIFDHHPIKDFFDTIWCADDGPGKPNPFMVEQAMSSLGAEPHESVMIGDAIFDIEMGAAARVQTHAVTWGFATRDELASVSPEFMHDTFTSLGNALRAFS